MNSKATISLSKESSETSTLNGYHILAYALLCICFSTRYSLFSMLIKCVLPFPSVLASRDKSYPFLYPAPSPPAPSSMSTNLLIKRPCQYPHLLSPQPTGWMLRDYLSSFRVDWRPTSLQCPRWNDAPSLPPTDQDTNGGALKGPQS